MVNGVKIIVSVLNSFQPPAIPAECLELRQAQSASVKAQKHVHHVSGV